MNPVSQTSSFDLSLATPAGRGAWAIAAVLFGGAVILDLATGRGGQASVLGCGGHQVIKPHATEPRAERFVTLGGSTHAATKVPPGSRVWNEALVGESRLSLSPARVRHAS